MERFKNLVRRAISDDAEKIVVHSEAKPGLIVAGQARLLDDYEAFPDSLYDTIFKTLLPKAKRKDASPVEGFINIPGLGKLQVLSATDVDLIIIYLPKAIAAAQHDKANLNAFKSSLPYFRPAAVPPPPKNEAPPMDFGALDSAPDLSANLSSDEDSNAALQAGFKPTLSVPDFPPEVPQQPSSAAKGSEGDVDYGAFNFQMASESQMQAQASSVDHIAADSALNDPFASQRLSLPADAMAPDGLSSADLLSSPGFDPTGGGSGLGPSDLDMSGLEDSGFAGSLEDDNSLEAPALDGAIEFEPAQNPWLVEAKPSAAPAKPAALNATQIAGQPKMQAQSQVPPQPMSQPRAAQLKSVPQQAPPPPNAMQAQGYAHNLPPSIPQYMPAPIPAPVQEVERKIDFGPDDPGLSGKYTTAPIDDLLIQMIKSKSSDVHLTLGQRVIYRIDGEIRRMESDAITPEDMRRFIEPIMPPRNRREFAEINDTDFAHAIPEVGRFRVNVFRDRNGVGAVIRHIPSKILTMEQLNLPPVTKSFCQLNKGLVLVTGPTGSGKSTTLAAMLDYINRTRADHMITIEDPIEFVHPQQKCLINQREVHRHTQSFSRALRAALREDPDIVLIGEMRDLETIAIAIETAETGHLVFGTLHTTTAVSTVDRIIDQFPADRQEQIRMMLSSSLKGVVSQTLIKKIGGGRVAALEILVTDDAVSAMIREGKNHMINNHLATQKASGNQLLNSSLLQHVSAGAITIDDAYLKSIDKKTFISMAQRAGMKFNPPQEGTAKSA